MFSWIKKIINKIKQELAYRKRLKELKKKDPFIYKQNMEILNKEKLYFNKLEPKMIENALKRNFSICWRWFYRMQIPMIIGYHDMFEDLTTFHVWGTVCMNQAFNYSSTLEKQNGQNDVHNYIDYQRELYDFNYVKIGSDGN